LDNCDIEEYCSGTSNSCPSDLRHDHAYGYKCGSNAYLCGVENGTDTGITIIDGQFYFDEVYLGIAKGVVYQLAWPACLTQCITTPLCPNGKKLSGIVYGTCINGTIIATDALLGSSVLWNSFPFCPPWVKPVISLTSNLNSIYNKDNLSKRGFLPCL
jgi:hypothetical protein